MNEFEELDEEEVKSCANALSRVLAGRKTPMPVAMAALSFLLEMAKLDTGIDVQVVCVEGMPDESSNN